MSAGTPAAGAADTEVLSAARDWLARGERVALVTVLHTFGSSPRPPGALLAIGRRAMVGSVSGGCVEEELARRYRKNELGTPFPTRVDFGIDSEEAGRMGLPCGGRLELLVEDLEVQGPVAALLARLDAGQLTARRVCLRTGEVSLHAVAGGAGDQRVEFEVTADAVTKVFGPAWHLLLIGDGQLARLLAQMARLLDYRVTICDPRELFADPAPLPEVRYSRLMPDDAARELADSPRSAIVTLTHDPKQDDLALTEALRTKAFYVGALGSARSAAARRERLRAVGMTAAEIDRLNAPAGLAIGSKRPAEIALSILAGITAARNGLAGGRRA